MTADNRIVEEAGDALPPGTSLLQGQFLVDGFLNAGGFGITYLARDSLDRRVVLKECYPSTMCCRIDRIVQSRSRNTQGEFDVIVRLFGQEARRLSKLEHPNIVGVRDVFEENGTAYMALDFVEGRDLADIIDFEPERISPAQIVSITRSLLDAIAHVHSQGMLHRDISPDNILIQPDNTPVLIDFGAARDIARRKSRILSALHVVKDGYSPQEFYLQNGEQSSASDLYSLGASLYHALVGEPPVTSHVRLSAIAERQPDPYVPLLTIEPEGYDKRFLAAIDKALAVFARDRLQSAEAWLKLIDGRISVPLGKQSLADDPEIEEKIRALVESTNVEVRKVQEKKAREAAEQAEREAEERAEAEAARLRRIEEARAEAEELERAYQEQKEREAEARALAVEMRRRAKEEAERQRRLSEEAQEPTEKDEAAEAAAALVQARAEEARRVRLERMQRAQEAEELDEFGLPIGALDELALGIVPPPPSNLASTTGKGSGGVRPVKPVPESGGGGSGSAKRVSERRGLLGKVMGGSKS
ncbi:MAG: serine/threonine-protein kinase [Pseudomonadota bacterium]